MVLPKTTRDIHIQDKNSTSTLLIGHTHEDMFGQWVLKEAYLCHSIRLDFTVQFKLSGGIEPFVNLWLCHVGIVDLTEVVPNR